MGEGGGAHSKDDFSYATLTSDGDGSLTLRSRKTIAAALDTLSDCVNP
jgi:hypothetical protein